MEANKASKNGLIIPEGKYSSNEQGVAKPGGFIPKSLQRKEYHS